MVLKYTDARGKILTNFASVSLTPAGCETFAEAIEPILRPYFNLKSIETLEYTLLVGESWTWPIPEPSHEDDSTDEHTFTYKVKTDKPMSFMEYFEKTLLFDIA